MAKRKNDQIAATQIAAGDIVDKSDMPAPEREPVDAREFLGLAAEIARDTIHIRNSRWPGAAEDFPHEPALRTCGKFFRDAEGGPLYMDEPVTKGEVEHCKRKADKLRARGLRYVYIHRINGIDPSIDSVLEQLGDLRGVA